MLFIPLVDKESTQRAFAEEETLLVLVISPSKISLFLVVIANFTTPGESHLYGLPLSLCRLFRPLGPFFVL